jgi:glycerol transport system ATP-binding protein
VTVTLETVSKVVGGQAHLKDVSLTFERGAVNVLLGATLAGKTTLMRIMAGLDTPSTGRVLVDGQDVTGVPVRRRNVAMVYQQFINYPMFTVYDNIASPLRIARATRAEVERRVRAAAELLHLEPYLKRKPQELSGGQQQRTAIARALVKGAALVLLDEPLANLDYKLREELREELPRIFRETGAVLVYATTEPTEALLLGGRTATVHEGRVTQFGPTLEVYRRPVDLTTARAFSDPPLNTMPVQKTGNQVRLATGNFPAGGTLAGLADGEYTIALRPHHLALAPPTPDAVGLGGTVTVSEITGSESYVHLKVAGHNWVALVRGIQEFEPGTRLDIYLDPTRLFVFDVRGNLAAAPAVAAAA